MRYDSNMNDPKEFLEKGLQNLTKRKKLIMSDYYSVDIDTALDFELAEFLTNKRNGQ